LPRPCEASSKYDRLIKSASDRRFGIASDWLWHKSRIRVESNFREDAKSPVGALGLSQFMEATALDYGAKSLSDRLDPSWSISAMVRYIGDIWNLFNCATNTTDRQMLTDSGYNCGQGRTLRVVRARGCTWAAAVGGLPSETRKYSPLIQTWKDKYRRGLAE